MVKNLSAFLKDYHSFQRIVNEYSTSYQYGLGQMNSKENTDRSQLLVNLQTIETQDKQQRTLLQQRVQEQLANFRRILQLVDAKEREITERRFKKFKSRRSDSSYVPLNQEERQHSQQDINLQVANTVRSIEKITKSRMPKSIAAICGFFNRDFREDAYRQIVENRQKLEMMLKAAERDLQLASNELKHEISQTTVNKVTVLQTEKHRLEISRSTERKVYLSQLRGLLLDALEHIFCSDTIYGKAHEHLANYLMAYNGQNDQHLGAADGLLLGIINQKITSSDDGTMDSYLSAILKDSVYSNASILLPVIFDRYFDRAFCVNYFSEYNEKVYILFGNLAIQLMNLFADVGLTTYLVDCTHMGSKYSEFTSFENIDDNKRINIIRTIEELKKVIDELSDYIIETNSSYLKGDFQNVDDYNYVSVIKREIKALFVSNVSEMVSIELLDKLSSIARNGSRCGVMIFIGISTDECQVSGLTSQVRVNAISTLLGLCDRICMSSSGDLSFGNGLPQFTMPPEINSEIMHNIIINTVQSKGALSIVPLAKNMLPFESFFKEKCFDNILIPIGIDAQGNEYSLNLNKDAAYMLIGGNPSCGKSSLIHTIILQCITRYSPDDLELFVADLKDGSEFDIYVQKGIRAVKVVLDDSETDIATSFLNYIKANVELRLKKFGELVQCSGQIVRNIEQFYAVNNERNLVPHIPRMLLIIDEFQSLYNSSRETGMITNWLVRMCRTVGIYIIMASQRVQADVSAVTNSFGVQTKEYFIYRAMFKLPYSGAKELMSERCSDTNRENPAIRKAQTLKNGQIVINPNMGATEEDNQIVQCYYPDNNTIALICEQVVSAQGIEGGIIMNSESPVIFDPEFIASDKIVLGESNRLYYDECNKNDDDFIDNKKVALKRSINRLLVCGNDSRVLASVLWSSIASLNMAFTEKLRINILATDSFLNKMGFEDSHRLAINLSQSIDDFITFADEQTAYGNYVLSAICNPYEYEGLKKDGYSRATETIEKILDIMKGQSIFMLILCESIKKLKDDCSYLEAEMPCRVISVGNPLSIRTAMTMDAGEKITDSPFNTARPNVIKAYYYNRATDKFGRCRLFQPEQIINSVRFNSPSVLFQNMPLTGYSGLVGN